MRLPDTSYVRDHLATWSRAASNTQASISNTMLARWRCSDLERLTMYKYCWIKPCLGMNNYKLWFYRYNLGLTGPVGAEGDLVPTTDQPDWRHTPPRKRSAVKGPARPKTIEPLQGSETAPAHPFSESS